MFNFILIIIWSVTFFSPNKDNSSSSLYLRIDGLNLQHIPNDVSIDAPLRGNDDVTMMVGYM